MVNSQNRYSVLDCKCILNWGSTFPKKGEYIYCRFHQRESMVTMVDVYHWMVKCQNCHFSRKTGMAQTLVETKAAGHRRRNPGHTVKITKPDGTHHKTYGNENQLQLPEDPEEIPF